MPNTWVMPRSLRTIPPFTVHGGANRAYSTACAAYQPLHIPSCAHSSRSVPEIVNFLRDIANMSLARVIKRNIFFRYHAYVPIKLFFFFFFLIFLHRRKRTHPEWKCASRSKNDDSRILIWETVMWRSSLKCFRQFDRRQIVREAHARRQSLLLEEIWP